MELMTLFWIALLGSIVWFVPVSATSVLYGSELGWNPLLIGAICSTAQCVGYVLLHTGGHQLIARWASLARRVEDARQRHLLRLEQAYLPTTLVAGLTGVPRMFAMASMAPAFRVVLGRFIVAAFPGRFVRYSVLAAAGHSIAALLGL
jgi:membrane protein YqaA with SNARE-associated domain